MTEEWILVPKTTIIFNQPSNFNLIDYHLDIINPNDNQDNESNDNQDNESNDNLSNFDDLEWHSCDDDDEWIYVIEEEFNII